MPKPSTAHVQHRIAALTQELNSRALATGIALTPAPAHVRSYNVSPANDNAIPYCPHVPTPKQRDLHALDDIKEVFFGGAARGGKTDGALQCALRYVHIPGFAALILRRNYNQLLLSDGVLARANEWLLGKAGVRWVEKEHAFVFQCPGGGTSRIFFGYLEHETDKLRYQGGKYQLIIFEELTHFLRSQYTYMFSRLDRPAEGPLSRVPLRMRSTGNPGGIGHVWVWERFVKADTRDVRAVFLPAKLTDNKHVDQAAYRESLSRLSPIEQAQLLEGKWDALQEGDVFKTDRILLIDKMPPNLMTFVRFWDCAATPEATKTGERRDKGDYTASVRMGMAPDRSIVILDVTENKWDVGELPSQFKLQADADGRATVIRIEEEGGHSGKAITRVYQAELDGYDCDGIHPTGPKLERAKPLSAAVYNRRVSALRGPNMKNLLDRMHAFPYVAHDDVIDAASGAFNFLEGEYVGELKVDPVRVPSRTTNLRKYMGASTKNLRMG